MAWTIDFTPEAAKALSRLGAQAQTRIVRFLRDRVAPADNPRALGEPLKGSRFSGLWRYRAGDYRILCEIEDERVRVLVVLLGHRREIYK